MNTYKKQISSRLFSLIGHGGSDFAERIVKKYRMFKGKNMQPELIFLRWINSGERSRNEDDGKSTGKEWKIDYHFKFEFFFRKMLRTFNKYAVMNYIKNFYRSSEIFFKPDGGGTASLQHSAQNDTLLNYTTFAVSPSLFKASYPGTVAHRDLVSRQHDNTIISHSLFYAFSGGDRMLSGSALPSSVRGMDMIPGAAVPEGYKSSVSLKQGARGFISPLTFQTLSGGDGIFPGYAHITRRKSRISGAAVAGAYKSSVSLQGTRSINLVFHTLKGAAESDQMQKSEIFQPGYTPVLWHRISIQYNHPEKSAYNIARFGKNLKISVINPAIKPASLILVNPAADNTGVKKPGIREIGSEYRFSEIVHTENMTSTAVDITRNVKLEHIEYSMNDIIRKHVDTVLKDTLSQKTAVKSGSVSHVEENKGKTSFESTADEMEPAAIADTVYRLIERRLLIEKEKRGFI